MFKLPFYFKIGSYSCFIEYIRPLKDLTTLTDGPHYPTLQFIHKNEYNDIECTFLKNRLF